MKKNRNCGMTMYPTYTQSMPMMGIQPPMVTPMPMINPNNNQQSQYQTYTNTYNNFQEQINNIQEQLNSLENRGSKLESKNINNTTYNNKYNDSNYYML